MSEQPLIAVVDSDDDVAEAVCDLLRAKGYRAIGSVLRDFATPESTAAWFQEHDVDAILYEIAPPYEESLARFERIRRVVAPAGQKAVLHTASLETLKEYDHPPGVVQHLNRPPNLGVLLDAIRKALT